MNLLKCFLTANPCYKTIKSIIPKGIMVHSTGANNPSLARYVQPVADTPGKDTLLTKLGVNRYANDWNHEFNDACVHAFIGKLADGSVATVQTLPWVHRGWHAGTGTSGKSANDTHISFEICEDALIDTLYFEKTKQEAVELTAMLCASYNLDPMKDGVVICHADGYRRGIASNHGDIYTWWNWYDYTMDDFRADVKSAMTKPNPEPVPAASDLYKTIDDVPDYYRPTIMKLIDAKALLGTGDGELNISDDFCRIFTILDRLGKL